MAATTTTSRRARATLPCHGKRITFHLPDVIDEQHAEQFRCTRCGAGYLGVVIEDEHGLRAAIQQVDEGLDGYVGLIEQRRSRDTGTTIGLYASVEGGIDTDPLIPFSLVCEDHSRTIGCESYTAARSQMSGSFGWCGVCNGTEEQD